MSIKSKNSKFLQIGGNDTSLDTFAAFLAKMLSLAESFGISLPGAQSSLCFVAEQRHGRALPFCKR